MLDEAQAQWTALLSGKEKDKAKLGKQAARMLLDRWNACAARRPADGSIPARRRSASATSWPAVKGEPSGKDVELAARLDHGRRPEPRRRRRLIDAHATLPPKHWPRPLWPPASLAQPAEVFDLFSPYLTAKVDEKKKGRDPAGASREALVDLLTHQLAAGVRTSVDTSTTSRSISSKRSTRAGSTWRSSSSTCELVQTLACRARGRDEAPGRVVRPSCSRSPKTPTSCATLLQTMVRIQHPEAADALIAALKQTRQRTRYGYGVYWIGPLIPELPKEALPQARSDCCRRCPRRRSIKCSTS